MKAYLYQKLLILEGIEIIGQVIVLTKIGMIDMISTTKINSIVYGIEILFLPV